MSFAPYHAFGGAASLVRNIRTLQRAGTVPPPILDAHHRYHYSLIHKLRCAREHFEELKASLAASADDVDALALTYRVNFHFDGFLYVVGSAMDIFAREVLSYYAIPLPHRVYYRTARQQLAATRPGDALLARLQDPRWRDEFANYRNTATHENVIGTNFRIDVSVVGDADERRVVFPLPDDPRDPNGPSRRNADVTHYVEQTFCRVLRLLNPAYVELARRVRAAGALPL